MPLLALGLNHKSAPLAVREQLAFSNDHIGPALRDLMNMPAINEAAIISTCNRTEVYCALQQPDKDIAINWFLKHHHLKGYDPRPYLYAYPDKDSVQHLFRVACGLDSMVLGEPQILGQLKAAYQAAEEAGALGYQLNRLFQHAFSVAKQVRTETEIGANPVSVAYAAVRLAQQIFTDLKQQTALLIGAGETIELVARHLYSSGIGKLIVVNRSLERAEQLARQFKGQAVTFALLPEQLVYSDIVISSTASTLPILGKGAVESALKKRKHRPIFMVDIAVPRDIEPEVGNLSDVYLYSIDDLENVIDHNLKSRQAAAKQAEIIIANRVDAFLQWQRSLSAVATIRQYRDTAQNISHETLQKALQQLAKGKPAEDVLQYLAHTLTNKLTHAPTVRLRQAAAMDEQELLQAAHALLKTKDSEI